MGCMLKLLASQAYSVGMQYTVRDIPDDVNKALRDKARAKGKSINRSVVEALRHGLCLDTPMQKKRDLSDFIGKSKPDPDMDKALAEFNQIDWEDWK